MKDNEFIKYATQHHGMSRMHLEKYIDEVTNFTPYIIEERQLNVQALDV